VAGSLVSISTLIASYGTHTVEPTRTETPVRKWLVMWIEIVSLFPIPGNADRMKAFVLTMRHSGLRIGDTIALKRERVKGNKLFLYTQKTGTPLYVPLPPAAVEALSKLNGDNEIFSRAGRRSRGPPARTGYGISIRCSSCRRSRTHTRTGSATRLRCRC
jgi:integrase